MAIAMASLREGDFVLLASTNLEGRLIGCFSRGVSHCGVMLRLPGPDGRLWFVHSYPDAPEGTDFYVPPGMSAFRAKFELSAGGVRAVPLDKFLSAHANIYSGGGCEVVRPAPPFDEAQLEAMRALVAIHYAKAFETNSWQLINSCLGCGLSSWCCATNDSYFCSELAAEMYQAAGRLPKLEASAYSPAEVAESLLGAGAERVGAIDGYSAPGNCCALCSLCQSCCFVVSCFACAVGPRGSTETA